MAKENLTTENPVKKSDHSSRPPRPEPARSESGPGPASSASFREITSGSERTSSMRKSSPPLLGWPIKKAVMPRRSLPDALDLKSDVCGDISDLKKQNLNISEMEMMKERFAKLLLGEDMSGSGKGVCTALAISNAITNLCATIFGQLWRLEPLPVEKKSMWKREMEWLLCVSDHIVELIPTWQNFSDGSKLEVMSCRPRTDIFINLPALRKLDNILLEILDSFKNTDFWYVDQGVMATDCDGSSSFRKTLQRQEEKWWLPVPRVPAGGLPENSRKQLDHKRECANQILKAAVAINSSVLADTEVPESFLEALPKNGRACLGDMIYRYITSEHFSPDCLLDCLDLSSDHTALEIANRVEAAIFVWRRRHHPKPPVPNANRSTAKSSWEMVKDLMVDGDKREVLAERAERLLLCLKQRCPGLSQTTLDTSKIQCNKDVGKSILEGYSRVLESLAYNIVARIDDLLYVDDLTKSTGKTSSSSNCPTVSVITTQKKKGSSLSVPISSTPYRTSFTSSSGSSSALVSPARGSRTQYVRNGGGDKPARRGGLGVRRVLTNYLGGDHTRSNKGTSETQQQQEVKGSKSMPRSSTDNKLSSSLTSSPVIRADKENANPQKVVTPGK